jgi:hypothetical protein
MSEPTSESMISRPIAPGIPGGRDAGPLIALAGYLSAAAIGGFVVGMGADKLRLEVLQKDEVPRDTYVLKRDFRGPVLKTQVIAELEDLVKTSKITGEREAWLLESKTFVSGLGLEKDNVVVPEGQPEGQKISTSVSTPLAYIFYVQSRDPLEAKVQGTVGVLKGLQRLYKSTP